MTSVKPTDWQPSPGILIFGKALDIVQSNSSISVIAGPGTGKTELLAQRANFLLTTGFCPPPRRILALAFKVDAAQNLGDRVRDRCDSIQAQRFESLTLDAFAKKLVDQFLESIPKQSRPQPDYTIMFLNRDIWEEFRIRNVGKCNALNAITDTQLNNIVHQSIPEFRFDEAASEDEQMRWLWWREQLDAVPSRLTYDMVKILAVKILQSQPTILSALRQTYSHVFLDEFQDVTQQQYNLIQAAFLGSKSIFTAVGDSNQAIMKWAGAREDIFNQFETDFDASGERLLFNYRSNSRIVELINSLASTFDNQYIPTGCARQDDIVPNNAVKGWFFETRQAEGEYLASFIANELQNNPNLAASDFVILSKLRVNDVEDRIQSAFHAQGLKIRNEARGIGGIAIQDLVKERAYSFLLASLKLAVNVREVQPFQDCRNTIADVRGADIESDKGHSECLYAVRSLIDGLKNLINGRPPSQTTGQEIADLILTHVEQHEIQRTYREYMSGDRLHSAIAGFIAFFDEYRAGTTSWSECISDMEGKNAVKLMTIYKSKGLEYHTVFFVEFNDDAFWGHDDDINVFFVALSRARERVYFSFCQDSRGYNNIQSMINRLDSANVSFVKPN